MKLPRKFKLRQLIQSQRTRRHKRRKEPNKNENTAKKRIERQLHRAVFLVGGSEDGDQEILRHDHQFVERAKQKQIRAKENAIAASHHQQQTEEKFVMALFDVRRH